MVIFKKNYCREEIQEVIILIHILKKFEWLLFIIN